MKVNIFGVIFESSEREEVRLHNIITYQYNINIGSELLIIKGGHNAYTCKLELKCRYKKDRPAWSNESNLHYERFTSTGEKIEDAIMDIYKNLTVWRSNNKFYKIGDEEKLDVLFSTLKDNIDIKDILE
jgi:hypothetical protein